MGIGDPGFQPSRFNYGVSYPSGAGVPDYRSTGTGSNYGDQYSQRGVAQQQYGDPYGPVANSQQVAQRRLNPDAYDASHAPYDPVAEGLINDAAFRRQWAADNLGFNNAWSNQQRGYAGSDYQNQLDLLNFNRGGLANQTSNAQANLGFTDEMIANLQKMYGINDRELANKIAQSWLDQSVQSNVLNQQTGLNALTGLQKTQANRSAGISSGMGFFPGYGVGGQQIAEETNRNADILANRLRGVVEGGDLTRQGLNIGAEGGRISLANQILGKQQGRLSDQQQLFDLQRMGGKYDIQQRGLQNQYNEQLGKLGYQQNQQWMTMANEMLNSNDASVRALGQQWMQQYGGSS